MRARENTIVVSSRLDARDLATVVLAWEQAVGGRPRSMSWLVREAIGTMSDLMEQKYGDLVKIESHQHAYEVIDGADLNARSTRALQAITKGMQNEIMNPASQHEPKQLQDDEMLLFAIKNMRSQGKSEDEITERMAPLMDSLAEQTRQKEAERVAAEKQAHEEMIAKFKQSKEIENVVLTPEQKLANYEESIVERMGEEWEGPIHSIFVKQIRSGYLRHFPDLTEEEFAEKLVPLLELAKPAIETRAERNKERLEQQEREKQAKRNAKAAVEKSTMFKL